MAKMKSKAALLSTILVLCLSLFASAEDVTITVKSVTNIATTDDNFVCATLDWWPEDKCDYGQCPWGKAGILNLVTPSHQSSDFYPFLHLVTASPLRLSIQKLTFVMVFLRLGSGQPYLVQGRQG